MNITYTYNYKQTVNTNSLGITRGYTGHEHWNELGLVDMNFAIEREQSEYVATYSAMPSVSKMGEANSGRFYDPVVGRFLSPDPYVQDPSTPQNFNRYSYCLNNPLKYTDPSGESFTIITGIVATALTYYGGVQANRNNTSHKWDPTCWDWNSGSTYVGLINGGIQGCSLAGYGFSANGIITNGLLQSGINVIINGIGNIIDGDELFDGAGYPALSGFLIGGLSGGMSALSDGKNIWWGNDVKYGRTKWSFFNTNKADYVIDFGINNVGSMSENDCVPTSLSEIADKQGGEKGYCDFRNEVSYVEGEGTKISAIQYQKLINDNFKNVESLQSDAILFDANYMQNAAKNGECFAYFFSGDGQNVAHADVVRKLKVYTNNPSLNKLIFRQSRYDYIQFGNSFKIQSIMRIF